jgi:hypothetical protein
MKVVMVTTDREHNGIKQLIRSLENFNIEYVIIDSIYIKEDAWARSIELAYRWAKENPGQEFIYVDAWDNFFLDGIDVIGEKIKAYNCKMLLTGEGIVFPTPYLESGFDDSGSIWNYVNGGGFWTNTDYFVWLIENSNFLTADGIYSFGKLQKWNQQEWLSVMHLMFRKDIKIDTRCDVFQTLRRSFDPPEPLDNHSDFLLENGRVINKHTNSVPSIIHGNGGVNMEPVYKLL